MVGNNPHPVAAVGGVDGASWNNKRPRGVTFSFQVKKHLVEAHTDMPSNILENAPSGLSGGGIQFAYNSHNLRPEVAVIVLALSLPGKTERLARVASANNGNWFWQVCCM
jgi:hypothetical protein